MAYTPTNEWKVLAPKKVIAHPMTAQGIPVNLVVLHHTVTPAGPFFDILRSIDRYHQSKVYYDIAYNGAASNVSPDYTDLRGPLVQGGATGLSNGEVIDKRSLSLVVAGDFQTSGHDMPTAVCVENVAQLIARWIRLGYVTEDFYLEPHRAYRSTSCCGDRLLAVIPAIRRRVNAIMDTSTVPVVTEEDVMRVPLEDWAKEFIRGDSSGEYNAAVELWQRALVASGGDPGPIDGVRGPATEAANKEFERVNRLRDIPNAFPEPNVWRELLRIMAHPLIVTETVEVPVIVTETVEVPAPVDPAVAVLVQRIRQNVETLSGLL